MDRPGALEKNGVLDRLFPDGPPAVPLMGCVHRDARIAEPFDKTTEEVLLVNCLVGTDTVELGRTVGCHDDDRHARERGFHHRRKVIGGGGAGRAEHPNRLTRRRRDTESEERGRPLINMHVQGDTRMARGRKGNRRGS